MRNPIYILSFVILVIAISCSHKTYRTLPGDRGTDNPVASQSEEEYAVQEPAWTYYERLSLALGCDSSCIGISSDMTLPDWYSGCFVNERDRLTINVIGDSLLKAVERASVRMSMSCSSNVDGTVDVTLEASNDSAIEVFKKEVFDSPLLRFKRADKVGIILDKEEVEVNDEQDDGQSYIEYETSSRF